MEPNLEKISLSIPLENAIGQVATYFELGHIKDFQIMTRGLVNLNIKLTTTLGTYVAKFYPPETSSKRNIDTIKAMIAYHQAGVSVPKVIFTSAKQAALTIPGSAGNVLVNVLEYFDGEDFNQSPPTHEDFRTLSSIIALLHNTNIKIDRFYNDWCPENILQEFSSKVNCL
jgi:Ser/Thr protein kinase RdoA (MazF antagonist)